MRSPARYALPLVLSLLALLCAACGGSRSVTTAPAGSDPGAGRSLDTAAPVSLLAYRPGHRDTPIISSPQSTWLPLGLTDPQHASTFSPAGSVQTPPVSTPQALGWYCPGRATSGQTARSADGSCGAPVPGDVGPATVFGHVNGGGRNGVFVSLASLRRGDVVEIGRSDGRVTRFTISKVQTVAKEQFPTQAVYGDTAEPALRLITCGGRLDAVHHRYVDQVIAYATRS